MGAQERGCVIVLVAGAPSMGTVHAATATGSSPSNVPTTTRTSAGDSGLPGSDRRCRVVVASPGNWSELAAVEKIFRQCAVEGVRVGSRVNVQPVGHAEILTGAGNRLDAAKVARPGADYYIAMESGLFEVELPKSFAEEGAAGKDSTSGQTRHFDTSWVLIERSAASPIRAAAPSCGVALPAADVAAVQERGFSRQTVTSAVVERVGMADSGDPHSWLTAGRRSRETLLTEALTVALGQIERAGTLQLFAKAPVATASSASGGGKSGMTRWLKGSSSST